MGVGMENSLKLWERPLTITHPVQRPLLWYADCPRPPKPEAGLADLESLIIP